MDLADSMQRQALKIAWHLRNLSLPNCEEQFVILSVGDRLTPALDFVHRKRGRIDIEPHTGGRGHASCIAPETALSIINSANRRVALSSRSIPARICRWSPPGTAASKNEIPSSIFSISSLVIIPSKGGVFEVTVDGDLIFSKKDLGRHAKAGEVMGLMRKRG